MAIVGALLAIAGFGIVVAGGALLVVHGTQRDSAGYYHTPTERLQTATAVLTSRLDLGGRSGDWVPAHPLGTVRIQATAVGNDPLFIGIAPADTVDTWLAGSRYERITRMRYAPFRVDSHIVVGTRPVDPPSTQDIWVASMSGTGTQTLTWRSEPGRWAVVLMNADARTGVAADLSFGARTGVLLPVGIVGGVFGLLLIAAGLVLVVTAVAPTPPSAGVTVAPLSPGAYPARLDARLDAPLSRWLWLVKWLLALPHVVVLVCLWLAVVPLTMVAGVAILITGRYPRAIFDFNLGVMRWTWRVSYYAFNAMGTDRYPPFSLRPDPDYPADFTVDYPQRLSRGLVLVKWWLLAIPHYVVVALLAGGWSGTFGRYGENWRLAAGGGLIGILVLVALVVLLFTGGYPKPLYDLVMGMNRWCYRVLAYAGLMRDEYPPFRLDMGGTDPGSRPEPTPVPPADRTGELVGAAGHR
jgi:hypothetical protein